MGRTLHCSDALTADAIAAELETSKQTIYRDIATLMGQRVPIRGEAGFGYGLASGFDLPPLMLTTDDQRATRFESAVRVRVTPSKGDYFVAGIGSIPLILIVSAAAGDARNSIRRRALAVSFEPDTTAAEKTWSS
jgi:hypothetical protein